MDTEKRDLREIKLLGNECKTSSRYPGNNLKLSRYSWLSFLPKNLFEQFQRPSNIWFVLVSVFQLIPINLSPTESWTTILPLTLLISLTLFKDAYIDFKIRRQNDVTNKLSIKCWDGNQFVLKKSEDLLVGHIVLVKCTQTVPADMLLIGCSNEEKWVYADNSRLTGMNEIKKIELVEKHSKMVFNTGESLSVNPKLVCTLKISEPNHDFTSFYGRLKLAGDPGSLELTESNILLKGSVLQGCEEAVGICMYCGNESKLQMNAKKNYYKTSRMERKVNYLVVAILVVLVLIVSFCLFGYYVIGTDRSESDPFLKQLITFVLLYNNIIPISLFMVIDIIRIVQSYAIEKLDKNVSFINERVNENLGQVDYILTDKTGTITENSLKIKFLIVDNKQFHILNEEQFHTEIAKSEQDVLKPRPNEEEIDSTGYFKSILISAENSSVFKEFLKCMALCNTLTMFKSEFLGSNDEKALVKCADYFGYKLLATSNTFYSIEIDGLQRQYEVIAVRPFSHKHKKSRVLLYEHQTNSGVLYFKGDCKMNLRLLNLTPSKKRKVLLKCSEMNEKGFRTMVLGHKAVPLEDINDYRLRIKRIQQSLVNIDGKIESIFKEIEHNIEYLGTTCIEDEVLPETADCINSLKEAGIKFWIVSSDSSGNTNQTALSSKIVEPKSRKVYISCLSEEYSCFRTLKGYLNEQLFDNNPNERISLQVNRDYLVQESLDDESHRLLEPSASVNRNTHSMLKKISNIIVDDVDLDRPANISNLDYSVFIDRQSFLTALGHESCRKMLVMFLICAKSVVFNCMMPEDKGLVVKLLKENVRFKPVVLALGKGEGDISMLQYSDVGISVNCFDGSYIKRFSDLTVKSFHNLEKVVLVYGYWSYSRLSRAIILFLYKNYLLTSMLFTYTLFCSFSGTSNFNGTLLLGYNIFFTTFPVLFVGIFDEDLGEKEINENRSIYAKGAKQNFNIKLMIAHAGAGCLHWGFLTILLFSCLPGVTGKDGSTENFDFFGTLVFIVLTLVVLIHIHTEVMSYSLIYLVSQLLSIGFLIVFLTVQNSQTYFTQDLVGIGTMIRKSPFALFSIFFTSLACVVPTYLIKYSKQIFFPGPVQLAKTGKLSDSKSNKLNKYRNCLSKVYCNSASWKSNSSDSKFSMSKFTLRYNLPHIEKEYEELYIQENSTIIKLTVIVIWLLLILWTIFTATLASSQNYSLSYTLVRVVITVFFCVLLFLIFTEHFWKFYKSYILSGVLTALVIKFILEVSFDSASILATALVPSITYVLLNVDWFYTTLLNVLNVLLGIISFHLYYSKDLVDHTLSMIKLSSLTIAITTTSSIVGYYLVLSKKTEHKLMNISNAGVERTQAILSLILPPFVKNLVKDGARYIAEAQNEVSVLFCDIYDFESICRDYKPNDLRYFLDSLFRIFDSLCESTGVTKIETVGKTYMACAGLTDSDKELPRNLREVHHTRRIIELANSILQEVGLVRLINGSPLQVKIGINTGPVVAGVVGYHKPQFSLVGDTVNTASRMCSTLAESNSIQVSSGTYFYIKNYEDLSFKASTVEAKGKGKLETFIVREKREEDSYFDLPGPNVSKNMSASINHESIGFSKKTKSVFETVNTLDLKRAVTGMISPTTYMYDKCNESEKEKEFRINKLVTNYNVLLLSLVIALATYILNLIVSLFEYYFLNGFSYVPIIVGRGVVIGFIVVIIAVHKRIYQFRWYPAVVIIVLLIMLLVALFNLTYSTKEFIDFTSLEIMYVLVILYHSSGASMFMVLIFNICVFVPWILLVSFSPNTQENITNLLLVACFSGINILAVYTQEQNNRKNHNLNLIATKEIKQTEKLLVQMMPPNVLNDLQNDKIGTDKLREVTVLYADIVGFTNWSSDKSPNEVVMMLSQLFSQFDKKCVEHCVYKVYTIGDCYVVLSFDGESARDPLEECLKVVKLAKDMVSIINQVNLAQDSELNMRIGIHTGDVIGGVIGTNTVRYDIWGPDVLIANKMESSGKPGCINVSEDTKTMLSNTFSEEFSFTFNSEVSIKSLRRTVRCYFLDSS